jgi:pyruvate dehydrogenase E2 component (dihydrolipoamide acetyltransferase)
MGYVVKLPKLGLEMEEGTILEWYVEEGDEIAGGDVLLEVESEKSIGEVEAREDGVLRLLAVGEGETVPPGAPIGIVADPEEDVADLEAELDSGNEESEDGGEMATDANVADGDSATPPTDDGTRSESATADVRASPRAKRRAEEVGVDLAEIDGTGPQGAITAEDVDRVVEATASETDAEAEASAGRDTAAGQIRASPRAKDRATDLGVDLTAVEGTGPQGAITEADIETAAEVDAEASPAGDSETDGRASTGLAASDSGETIRFVDRYRSTTVVADGAEVDGLLEARRLASEAFGLDVSVLDVLLVAVSATLPSHPSLDATFDEGTHHLHSHQRVAIGTSDESPAVVIDEVAEQSFADLVTIRQSRVGDESGEAGNDGAPATFALATGDDPGTVLEAPTVAGLAVDVSKRRAVPTEEGAGVSLERYLSCSLSYDPRAVGDADARAFLEGVLDAIERAPELLLRTYR